MPTFNEERYIGNLLKSLKNQTYKDFELIVIDGGSRDKTVEIAEKHNARAIVKSGAPEYQSRNIGGEVASGDLLLFTSADVIFEETALRMVASEFMKNGDLGAMCGFGKGKVYDAPVWTKIEYNAYYVVLGIWAKLTKDFHGNGSFISVRKKLFLRIGGFTERTDADGFFLNKLGKYTRMKFVLNLPMQTSGRRAKKMGFIGFNTHYLFALDAFFPFLRESRVIKFLEYYMISYRVKRKAAASV